MDLANSPTLAARLAVSGPTGRATQGWSVGCRDLFGRQRAVTVLAQPDRVVLVAPPGQAAVLSGPELARLHRALTEAVQEAAGHAGKAPS